RVVTHRSIAERYPPRFGFNARDSTTKPHVAYARRERLHDSAEPSLGRIREIGQIIELLRMRIDRPANHLLERRPRNSSPDCRSQPLGVHLRGLDSPNLPR